MFLLSPASIGVCVKRSSEFANSSISHPSRASCRALSFDAGRPQRSMTISTLNSLNLQPSDFQTFFGERQNVHFPSNTLDSPPKSRPGLVVLSYQRYETHFVPFPDRTQGFLYYVCSQKCPTAGKVRIRVTEGTESEHFARGHDLLRPTGLPWEIPFPAIAHFPIYSPVLDLLVRDRFVTDPDLQQWQNIFAGTPIGKRSVFIYSLHQPFHISFDCREFTVCIVGRTKTRRLTIRAPFTTEAEGRPINPYAGSALAHFELSTAREHRDNRTVVLRFAQIVRPVTLAVPFYRGILPKPEAGNLLMRPNKGRRLVPWSVHVDSESRYAEPLKILLDDP